MRVWLLQQQGGEASAVGVVQLQGHRHAGQQHDSCTPGPPPPQKLLAWPVVGQPLRDPPAQPVHALARIR